MASTPTLGTAPRLIRMARVACTAPEPRRRGHRRRSSLIGIGLYAASRQYHAKRRPFTQLALQRDLAPHRGDNLPHDPQPQSKAAVPSLRHRALEPLKDDLML